MTAILIDLDDTLLDDRSARWTAFAALFEAHQAALADETHAQSLDRWRSIFRVHWQRFERGEVSFQDHRRARVREFLRQELSASEADAAFAPYLEVYEASCGLMPDGTEFLERTRQIPKVIVTNGDRDQQLQKVRRTGLEAHTRATITPADCGHWKPAPGMFLLALERLGVSATDCHMIGDDPVRDIEPAEKLGMRTHLVDQRDPARTLLRALDRL